MKNQIDFGKAAGRAMAHMPKILQENMIAGNGVPLLIPMWNQSGNQVRFTSRLRTAYHSYPSATPVVFSGFQEDAPIDAKSTGRV